MLECARGGQNSGWTDAWKNNKESKEENANEVDLKATQVCFSPTSSLKKIILH